ncbi:hypothetical protein ACQBJO_12730 [Janibacter sp. G349]|uniref:hypothetical protein n=1 Tax=unclassified Janibacter TaxID=2649294 RepID=UPI0020CEDE9C|nr:hypothetical protein [Janibacter sp. CX7]UTT65440.1 hypothetical protein NMQ01_12065 [Janibacter sp. CX7]
MKRTLIAVVGGVGLALIPSMAYAVTVSSDDGSGTFYVQEWFTKGYERNGSLKSTHGDPVYFSGKVVFDNEPDYKCGRYTPATSSLTAVKRQGYQCVVTAISTSSEGGSDQICRDVPYSPDPCGSWSSTIRK